MKTKLEKASKRAQISKLEKERMDVATVLSKCVNPKQQPPKMRGIAY